jgi:aldehyde dehydrogenase (NAD+)
MGTLVLGNPLDKNTDLGAINSSQQQERISQLVAAGQQEGCEVWDAGQSIPERGSWFRPTLLLGCAQSHRVVQEEIFGPVLTVQTFRTPEEAVQKANNTPYGLSGGVWTDKGAKSFSVTSKVKAGVLWANTYNRFDPCSPFGGFKESGVGREGGVHGLAPYVEVGF